MAKKAESLIRKGDVERITKLSHVRDFVLRAAFSDGRAVEADFSGLIDRSTHFSVFAGDAQAFGRVKTIHHGTGIEWENGLDYSAGALLRLGAARSEMTGTEFSGWIEDHDLSLNEAADIFGVTRHTIMNYRRRATVPQPIKVMCDAMDRDSTMFYGRLRPRRTGRPRKSRAA